MENSVNALASLVMPSGLLGDTERNIQPPPSLQLCEVHDVLAYGRCYVIKPVGMPRMPAMLGSLSSSMLPTGIRDITTIIPGSLVLCWISSEFYAVILSVVSLPVGSNKHSWPDSIVAASHAGIFADQAHQIIASKPTAHGFLNFSAGAPIDSLPGDWGHANELGMMLLMSRLMLSMRAGDLCKLEMHYVDMLARLYAYNWQHYTAGSEDEAFDDEGEWTRIRGFSPFPWEAAGVINGMANRAFDVKSSVNPKESTELFGVEPVDQLQTSFVRYKEFEGFLGDLRRAFVVIPRDTRRLFGREKKDKAQYSGVFEEILGMDGSYHMRSAKSIGFEKTLWIPVPEERYQRDNPNGDHDITPAGTGIDFTEFPAEDSAGKAMARLRDEQAYDINKRKSAPLNTRDKDWLIRDDITEDNGKIATPGDVTEEISALEPYDTFEQPMPAALDVNVAQVGDRNSRYYKTKAFIGILPDGSILLRDGWGSEIRMCGGNIEITCPGDVISRPGRSAHTWAGNDITVKAHNSIDVSAANGNVRVKAEDMLSMLGGNNGTGGVLLESRGAGETNNFSKSGDDAVVAGLVIKSTSGSLTMYGKSVYCKSMDGGISLDADSGDGSFIVCAGEQLSYLSKGSLEVVAGSKNGTDAKLTYVLSNWGGELAYYGQSAIFGVNSLSITTSDKDSSQTSLVIAGNITAEGSVSGVGEYVDSGSPPRPSSLNSLRNTGISTKTGMNDRLRRDFIELITGSSANGNKNVYELIGFSFRSSANLHLGGMVIMESEWQKRFRQSYGALAGEEYSTSWSEPIVYSYVKIDDPSNVSGVPKTRPAPGHEAWENNNETSARFGQVDDAFYFTKVNTGSGGVAEVTGGRPIPRGEKGSNYALEVGEGDNKTSALPDFSVGPFKDRYPINIPGA